MFREGEGREMVRLFRVMFVAEWVCALKPNV
jgi:hypothetical protein